MLACYGVEGREQETVLRHARAAQQKEAWWHHYRDVTNVWTYLSFEDDATAIRSFEALLVPGLLQIEDYARTVIPIFIPDLSRDEIERHVEVRMARQALLTGPSPPTLWVILDEAVLHRPVGSRQVMRKQLDHLIEAIDMPNVTGQVLRFQEGAHVGMNGAFTILSFHDPGDPDIVYLEHTGGDVLLDSADDVRAHVQQFEKLQVVALSPNESVDFLVEFVGEL
jgi:hypothetical protein